VALPLKVICQSDCRGLCPSCGANLTMKSAAVRPTHGPREWAPLARLKQTG